MAGRETNRMIYLGSRGGRDHEAHYKVLEDLRRQLIEKYHPDQVPSGADLGQAVLKAVPAREFRRCVPQGRRGELSFSCSVDFSNQRNGSRGPVDVSLTGFAGTTRYSYDGMTVVSGLPVD